MFTRISLVVFALLASSGALAQEFVTQVELGAGGVRQLNVTQAHLREMKPQDDTPNHTKAPVVARLVGKLISAHVKGLNLEVSSEPESGAHGLQDAQGALRLNRRAEICYENYRLGIKRGGVQMKYELTF